MSLEQTQLRFARAMLLARPASPADLPGFSPPQRLALYQSLVRGSLWMGLDLVYPFTRELLGDPAWSELRFAFQEAHPPCHWDLNQTALELPEWLEEAFLPSRPQLPAWAAALADYEREELNTLVAPDAEPVGPLGVNPTASLHLWDWDVASWVRAGRPDQGPEARPTLTAFVRDRESLLPRMVNLTPMGAGVLQGLLGGLPLEEVVGQLAQASGLDPAALRPQLDGLITQLSAQGFLCPPGRSIQSPS